MGGNRFIYSENDTQGSKLSRPVLNCRLQFVNKVSFVCHFYIQYITLLINVHIASEYSIITHSAHVSIQNNCSERMVREPNDTFLKRINLNVCIYSVCACVLCVSICMSACVCV